MYFGVPFVRHFIFSSLPGDLKGPNFQTTGHKSTPWLFGSVIPPSVGPGGTGSDGADMSMGTKVGLMVVLCLYVVRVQENKTEYLHICSLYIENNTSSSCQYATTLLL